MHNTIARTLTLDCVPITSSNKRAYHFLLSKQCYANAPTYCLQNDLNPSSEPMVEEQHEPYGMVSH